MKDPTPIIHKRLIKGPVSFRMQLQRMGPIFIKIGQYLALRPDILPQEYCDELMLFFEEVSPFSWMEAKAIISEELGGDPFEIFDHINPRPVAAGSLAQVHIACLKSGAEVAVKIQRPGIQKKVIKDLKRAKLLARFIEMSGRNLSFSPSEVVQEITEWMLQEMNFEIELSNLTQLYHYTKNSNTERIPKPYPEFSSSRVLTTEYFRGISFSEMLKALKSGHEEELDRIKNLGVNYHQLASNLFKSCLQQIFSYQFFHADLHPGNLIAQNDNKVGFVDFGLCDQLDETVRQKQMRYLAAVYNQNIENIYKAITEILVINDETDMEAFKRDFLSETSSLFKKRKINSTSNSGESRSPLSRYLLNIMQSARVHKLQVPTKILSIYRALLTAETVATQLNPTIDLGAIGRDFFVRIQIEEFMRSFEPSNMQGNLLSLLTFLRNSPIQLQQLLSELSEGKFSLNVSVTEVPKSMRLRNRQTQVIVFAIISVGIAILLSKPDLPVLFGIRMSWVLLTLLLLFYFSIFLQLKKLK